jgi:3-hydroxyacyl-CoA dehydrogenase
MFDGLEDHIVSSLIRSTSQDGVAILEVNNPPVNALSLGVPEALLSAIEAAEADPSVSVIVVMGAGRTFVAGADIATLERAAWGELGAATDLHSMLARIEDSSKPVVMAIHGTALGGGLELAMAGHYRVALPSALLGQPEVNLGIIPGAEGTQRLPRLVGVEKALDMCVTGKPVKAAEGLAAGLIDRVVDGDLASSAAAFAREVVGAPYRKTRDRDDRLGPPAESAILCGSARELAAKIRKRQIAPVKAVDAIEAAATLPFAEGARRERDIFFECVQGEQAKALIHVFFAERAVAKVPGLSKDAAAATIARVGIVGAGTMGGGIAMASSNAGIPVRLEDTDEAAVAKGIDAIRRNYEISIDRGRLTREAVDQRLERITTHVGDRALADADLIIEAAYESLELKKRIFSSLDTVAKPGCILATNTSTLDIDEIASVTSRPESVVGLHFFSPAHVMRLVEVVRGRATDDRTIATALAFAKRIGKVAVVVGNCRGFVGNRMMFPYMYEAQFLAEDGAAPEQVDRALTDFGMAMGIFAVDDMAGLDVAWRVRQELGHFSEPGIRRPLLQDALYEMGRLGQKTGKGWYKYEDKRKATPDPIVRELIRATAERQGIRQRTFTDQEIVERTLYALINEGARVLEEGFAERASDIDTIYVNGYGFPAWRGGPMFYADRIGIGTIYNRVRAFHQEHGERWAPAPLLARLAKSGGTFRDLDRARA